MINFLGKNVFVTCLCWCICFQFFVATAVLAAPDFDKIKSNVEQSAQKRKEFRENGGEVGQPLINDTANEPDSAEINHPTAVTVPVKVEIKIIWTMLGGHIKYWQVNGQYFLHLG